MILTHAPTPAKDATRVWLPGLEILRGIAALTVVFHHSWSLGTTPRFPGYWIVEGFGDWGVSLFFVLSGFLLADHFWSGDREGRLKRFYVRRLFRLLPAYYVNVAILFLFLATHQSVFSSSGLKQVLSNLTFTHFLRPETSSNLNVNGALWTLSIEALLYMFMPLLAFLTRWTKGWAPIGMIAVGLAYRFYVARAGSSLQSLYFDAGFDNSTARLYLARQFIGILPLFGIGIGLKWLTSQRGLRWPVGVRVAGPIAPWIVTLLLPSVLWLVFIERSSLYSHWVWFTGFDFILGLLFVPVILFAARPVAASDHRVDKPFVWLGVRSFGLYLWHFPIILSVYGRGPLTAPPDVNPWAAKMLLILVLSLGAAALSWSSVEKPAQAIARRLTSRPSPLRHPVDPPVSHVSPGQERSFQVR